MSGVCRFHICINAMQPLLTSLVMPLMLLLLFINTFTFCVAE